MSKKKPLPIKRIQYRDKITGQFIKKPERRTVKIQKIVLVGKKVKGKTIWKEDKKAVKYEPIRGKKNKKTPSPGKKKTPGKGSKPEKVTVLFEATKMAVLNRQIDEIIHNLLAGSTAKSLMGISKKKDYDKILEYILFYLNGNDKREPLTYMDAVKITLLSNGNIELKTLRGKGLKHKD